MNVKQMDIVIELSKTLNFNRAAENLYITQPALSYQVKMLEDEIGFKLFNRKNGVSMTRAGSYFCERIKNIKSEIDMVMEEGKMKAV